MKRYACVLLLFCLGPMWASEALFRIFPRAFYFRSWEYFEDLPYRTSGLKAEWKGTEYGDRTRANLFLHQERRENLVTTDADGFRAVPRKAEVYPVVVYGESNVFGSGVSDSETLPWRLSELLDVPVFNAARAGLYAVLERESFPKPAWVVECVMEKGLDRKFDPVLMGARAGIPRLSDRTVWEAGNMVPGERYRFHSLLRKWYENAVNDLVEWNQAGFDSKKIRANDRLEYSRTLEDLETPVRMIVKRKKWMDRKGIRYLFVPLPSKWVVEGAGVDGTTRHFTGLLVERLRREGVAAIDLGPVFKAHRGSGSLHFRFDTHLNPAGLDLAAREIAAYLRSHGF